YAAIASELAPGAEDGLAAGAPIEDLSRGAGDAVRQLVERQAAQQQALERRPLRILRGLLDARGLPRLQAENLAPIRRARFRIVRRVAHDPQVLVESPLEVRGDPSEIPEASLALGQVLLCLFDLCYVLNRALPDGDGRSMLPIRCLVDIADLAIGANDAEIEEIEAFVPLSGRRIVFRDALAIVRMDEAIDVFPVADSQLGRR